MLPEFEFTVRREVLEWYRSGGKDLEVRVGFPMFRRLCVGQVLKLYNNNDGAVRCRIQVIRRYRCFEQMLENERAERIVPGIESNEMLLQEFHKIWPVDAERHGVLVFEVIKLS